MKELNLDRDIRIQKLVDLRGTTFGQSLFSGEYLVAVPHLKSLWPLAWEFFKAREQWALSSPHQVYAKACLRGMNRA